MNLHEYQARTLLQAVGIPMFDGDVASTPTEAEAIARRIGGTVVIKAQVHAGGRGKAGGVKLARNPAEAADEGGFLGFGGVQVSDKERATLGELSNALGIKTAAAPPSPKA